MTIIEFLKRSIRARMTCGIRWLVWSRTKQMWHVYEKQIIPEGLLLIATTDEAVAIGFLEGSKG